MNKLLFLFLFFVPYLLFAGIQVLNKTATSVVIEYRLEGLDQSVVTFEGNDYILFRITDGVIDRQPGKPALPAVQSELAIPRGATLRYSLSVMESETRSGVDVLPQSELFIRGKMRRVPRDPSVYQQASPFPSEIVSVGKPFNFRGVEVVEVRINPIRYYPQDHRVELNKRIRIAFQFQGGTPAAVPARLTRYERNILNATLINPRQAQTFLQPKSRRLRKLGVNYDFSTGRWFRIPITSEGIYAVTGSFLQSKGVNIGEIQLSGVHIYNYGGFALPYDVNEPRPSDLNEIAVRIDDKNGNGVMDANDRIVFYGKGVGGWKFNESVGVYNWDYYGHPVDKASTSQVLHRMMYPYDDTNYYLFTYNDQPGKRIQVIPSPQLPNPDLPSTFTDFYHFEEDHYNILASGTDWYWERMSGARESKTIAFSLPQNLANGKTKLLFRFKGGSGSFYGDNEPYQYFFKGVINDQVVFDTYPNAPLSSNNSTSKIVTKDELFAVKGGSNELKIDYTGNLDGCEAFLDYFEVILQRPFIAENNFLHFRKLIGNNVPVEYHVSGLGTGEHLVWDITDFANIIGIEPVQNGTDVVFQDVSQSLKPSEYYVFSDAAIKDITKIEEIENHPNLRDPSRKAEYLIITTDEFYDAAEFLEHLRETQVPNPLETERVRLSDVFLEFSSSVRDVTALRDFLKYAFENWSDTLKYVLLLGDGHYDYRRIQLTEFPNFVPPFEIFNKGEVDSREADNFYVDFGFDGYLNSIKPWVPMGRLPVNSLDEIETYKNKLLAYSTSFLIDPDKNEWQMHVTLVSDDQNGSAGSNKELSWHLKPTEEIDRNYIPKKFNRRKIYLHDYEQVAGGLGRWKPKATEDLVNQINRGTLLISYFGHGNPETWAHESVINRTRDLPKIHNVGRWPLWVAATCTWGKFDDATRLSMSEELLWLHDIGGISVLSASRPVFVYSNTVLAKNFYKHLFHIGQGNLPSRRLGDALFLAMQTSTNYQKYHLYGDPTMRLADPEYIVKVESVEPDTLKALSTVTITAVITDAQGNIRDNFNGYAVVHAFDAVDSMYTNISNINLHYVYPGGTIFKGLVSVTNGELHSKFIVPKSIKYKNDRTGRLSIYAWSEQTDAGGYVDTLLFNGSQEGGNDRNGPEIQVAFKDVPDFFDGDFVGSQPTLMLELNDESGINLTGEVGHRIELTIDETMNKDITDFFVYQTNSYQDGKLEYTLPAMSSGIHQLKISCWDNMNNYSETLVTFRTSVATELNIYDIVNFPNPFSQDTYFTFQLALPVGVSDAQVNISIYTVTGRKIQEIQGIAQMGFNKIYWDGRDWDGDLIANGVYLYKIVVDDGTTSVEKTDKLAVVR